jgi:hypothetical protein
MFCNWLKGFGNMGLVNYSNQSFNTLKACGMVNLYRVTVTNSVRVDGNLNIKECRVGDIQLSGYLSASQLTAGPLQIRSTQVDLKNSTIRGNISMESTDQKQPVLTLEDSNVEGDISFSPNNPGIVRRIGHSTIRGQIHHGAEQLGEQEAPHTRDHFTFGSWF